MLVNTDHRPTAQVLTDHLTRTATADLPKRVLPRVDVPDYLIDSPMQDQTRHADSFHTNMPQQMQADDKPGFMRPSLADNLALVDRNLARGNGYWFDMRYRKDDSGEPRVPAGDGTPWNLHPQE